MAVGEGEGGGVLPNNFKSRRVEQIFPIYLRPLPSYRPQPLPPPPTLLIPTAPTMQV